MTSNYCTGKFAIIKSPEVSMAENEKMQAHETSYMHNKMHFHGFRYFPWEIWCFWEHFWPQRTQH